MASIVSLSKRKLAEEAEQLRSLVGGGGAYHFSDAERPMQVLPFSELQACGKIPHYSESRTIPYHSIPRKNKAIILYVCYMVMDNENKEEAETSQALVMAVEHLRRKISPEYLFFLWMDTSCVNREDETYETTSSLRHYHAYMERCDGVIVLYGSQEQSQSFSESSNKKKVDDHIAVGLAGVTSVKQMEERRTKNKNQQHITQINSDSPISEERSRCNSKNTHEKDEDPFRGILSIEKWSKKYPQVLAMVSMALFRYEVFLASYLPLNRPLGQSSPLGQSRVLLFFGPEQIRNGSPPAQCPLLALSWFRNFNPLLGDVDATSNYQIISHGMNAVALLLKSNQAREVQSLIRTAEHVDHSSDSTDKYEGDTNEQGRPHGTGKMRFAEGGYYGGKWMDGKYNGTGTLVNKCGDKYSGSWKDGLKHGKGKLVTAAAVLCGDDGFKGRNHRCSGTAKCGEEQGKQKWKVKDNIQVYEGDWLDDKKCGIGKIVYHSGVVFEGELEDDKPVKGTLSFPDGSTYEGAFQGVRHGEGTMRYRGGGVYIGSWVKGKREGKGIYTMANNDRYTGRFQQDMCHGSGEWLFKNGDIFLGNWIKDKRHGRGVLTPANKKQPKLHQIWDYGTLIKETWFTSTTKCSCIVS